MDTRGFGRVTEHVDALHFDKISGVFGIPERVHDSAASYCYFTGPTFLRHGIKYLGAGFRVCGSGDLGPRGCAAKARHPGECARPMVKPYC